jgi:hypothetical protein
MQMRPLTPPPNKKNSYMYILKVDNKIAEAIGLSGQKSGLEMLFNFTEYFIFIYSTDKCDYLPLTFKDPGTFQLTISNVTLGNAVLKLKTRRFFRPNFVNYVLAQRGDSRLFI